MGFYGIGTVLAFRLGLSAQVRPIKKEKKLARTVLSAGLYVRTAEACYKHDIGEVVRQSTCIYAVCWRDY